MKGSSDNLISLTATAFDPFIIAHGSVTGTDVDYVSVSNSDVTGTYIDAKFNSVNGGNVTIGSDDPETPGWIFRRDVYNWNGSIDTSWDTLANWTRTSGEPVVQAPGIVDWVLIPGGRARYPQITTSVSVANLNVGSGGELTVGNGGDVQAGSLNNEGRIVLDGTGTINRTDTDSGTFVFRNRAIINFGSLDYFNLEVAAGTVSLPGEIRVANNVSLTGGTLQSDGSRLIVGGSWSQTGGVFSTGSAPDDTVRFTGTGTISGQPEFHNLTIAGGATVSLNSDIRVNGNILLHGTLNGGSRTIRAGGNWTRGTGVFNAQSSTVEFIAGSGASQVFGNNTFNVLASKAAGKAIEFQVGHTQTFNDLDIVGASGNLIVLKGTGDANWTFRNMKGSPAVVSFVDVRFGQVDDSGSGITALDSTDGGNNDTAGIAFWDFSPSAIAEWAGGTPGSENDWSVADNWDPVAVPGVASSIRIPDGVTHYPELTGNITVFDLTIEENAQLTTSADIIINGSLSNAGTIIRTGGDSQNISKTDSTAGTVRYENAGTYSLQTYPGVDYHNLEIAAGTAQLVGDLDVSGNFTLSGGSFEQTSGVTSFVGAEPSVVAGTPVFHDLSIDKTVDGVTIEGALTIGNNLIINSGDLTLDDDLVVTDSINLLGGSLTAGTNTITLEGNWNRSGGAFSPDTGTVAFANADKTSVISGSNTFNNLRIEVLAKSVRFAAGTTQTVSGLTVTGDTADRVKLRSTVSGSLWNLDVSATATLSNVFLSDAQLAGSGAVTFTGVTEIAGVSIDGDFVFDDSDADLVVSGFLSATGQVNVTSSTLESTSAGSIQSGNGEPITLTTNSITIGASISGTNSALTLQPLTTTHSIGIAGGAGDFSLTQAEINRLQDGFASITIGRDNGQHDITIGSVTFIDPVVFRTPDGGSITVAGQITGADNASLTFNGSGATTTLNADVVTAGNPVTFDDAVILGADVTIDTTDGGGEPDGADITFNATVDADDATANDRTLTLNAGTGGEISVSGEVGGAANGELAGLTITNSNGATFTGAVTVNDGAGSVTISDTEDGQTVSFVENVDATTLTAMGTVNAYHVSLTGNTTTITGSATFENTGELTLGDVETDNLSFTGGLTATTQSRVNMAGTISTDSAVITFTDRDIRLTATTVIDTEQGNNGAGGAVAWGGSTVSATGADIDLTIDTSTGAGAGGNVTLGVFNNAGTSYVRNLSVITTGTPDGTLSTPAAVHIGGRLSLDIGTSNATVTAENTDLGSLAVESANDVTIAEAGGLEIAASAVGGTLSVTSTGSITDSGTITVTGQASFETRAAAGVAPITLNQGGVDNPVHSFGSLVLRTRNAGDTANVDSNITVYENADTELALVDTGGAFELVSYGEITQTGRVTVGGEVSFETRAAAAAGTITLTHTDIANPENTFGSLVLRTLDATGTAAENSNITVYENAASELVIVQTGGNLELISRGAITDSGEIEVGGTSLFEVRSNDGANIRLDYVNGGAFAHSFGGAITARTRRVDNDDLTDNTIDIYAAGAISVGVIETGSGAGARVYLESGAGISSTIDGTADILSGAFGFRSAEVVNVETAVGVVAGANSLADSSVTLHNLSGGDLSIGSVDPGTVVNGLTTTGDASSLTLTVGSAATDGTVSQTEVVTVPGTLTVTSLHDAPGAANVINLMEANNAGSLVLASRNQADDSDVDGTIRYRDTDGFVIADGQRLATSGLLSLSSDAGTVGDEITGAIAAGELVLLGGASWVLDNGTHDITTLAAVTRGLVFHDVNGFTVGTVDGTTGVSNSDAGNIELRALNGDLTIDEEVGNTFAGGEVLLSAEDSNTSGDGDLLVNAAVSSSDGAITLNSDAGDITFAVTGDVSSGGGNIGITADAGALTMADNTTDDTTVVNAGAGTITLSADGDITIGRLLTTNDTISAVSVSTTNGSILDAGDIDGEDIVANAAGARVSLSTGAAGQIDVTNGLETQVHQLALDVGTGGAVISETDAVDVFTSTVDGALTLTVGGAISDSGAITVTGQAHFETHAAAGAAAITLDQGGAGSPDHEFGSLVLRTMDAAGTNPVATNITVYENADTELALVETDGAFELVSYGSITQTGPVTVGGEARFQTRAAAGNGAITLMHTDIDNPENTFGSLVLRTLNAAGDAAQDNNITVYENAASELAGVETGGNFELISRGEISDSGQIEVGGTSLFEVRADGGADIRLDFLDGTDLAHIFGGAVSARTRRVSDATLTDNTIDIYAADAISVGLMETGGGAGARVYLESGEGISSTIDTTADIVSGAFGFRADGIVDVETAVSVIAGENSLADSSVTLHNLSGGGLSIGSVDPGSVVNGLTTTGGGSSLMLTVGSGTSDGTVSQTEVVTVPGTLTVTSRYDAPAAADVINLMEANNAGSLVLASRNRADNTDVNGTIRYRDTDGFVIPDGEHLATVGLLSLTSDAGTVGDEITGAIAAGELVLLGGASWVLDNGTHDITTLAAVTRGLVFHDVNGFTVGAVDGTAGVSNSVAGNIELRALNGDLTINETVENTFASGEVSLSAEDSNTSGDGDLLVNAAVSSSDGAITLNSDAGDITFAVTGNVSSGGGDIEITANAGAVTMADNGIDDTTVVNAAAGTISVSANGNITIGRLLTTNATDSAVSVISTDGSILDAGDTDGEDIVANAAGARVSLSTGAAGQIDVTEGLETQVHQLALDVGTGGAVISETDAVDVFTSTVDGALTLTVGGAISDSGAITVTGQAHFETHAAAGAAAITLNQGGAGSPVHEFGSLVLRTMDAAGTNPVATNITVYENADTVLALVDTGGLLTVVSTGAITDSGTVTTGTTNVTAQGSITLDHEAPADTPANNLGILIASITTNPGNLVVRNSGALQLGDGVAGISVLDGTIDIQAGGAITQGTAGTVATTDSGTDPRNITLRSTTGNIEISRDINGANGALVTLDAAGSITRSAGTISTGANGIVDLTSGAAGAIGADDASDGAVDDAWVRTETDVLRVSAGSGGAWIQDADAIQLGDGTGGVSAAADGLVFIDSAAGTISTGAAITTDGPVSLRSQAGTPLIRLGHTITTSGDAVRMYSAVELTGNVVVDTTDGGAVGSEAGADITFDNTIDADAVANNRTLTLNAGTGGAIGVTGVVGGTEALAGLTITNSNDVTVTNGVTAASFTQVAGGGTTTFNGAQDYTGDFDFTGQALTVNAAMAVGGTTEITNAGQFTKNNVGAITSTGAFTQNGGGLNSLGANITTTDTNLSFATGVTLTEDVQLSTGGNGGNVVFSSTVDGAQNLTVTAGEGNVTFSGIVGTATESPQRPANVSVNTAGNLTIDANMFVAENATFTVGNLTLNAELHVEGSDSNGVLRIYTPTGTETVGLGEGAGDLQITTPELGRIRTARSIIIGENGTQSGIITATNAQFFNPINNLESITINSDADTGGIILNDDTNTALDINGNTAILSLYSGSGGITAHNAGGNNSSIAHTGGGSLILRTVSTDPANLGVADINTRIVLAADTVPVRINNVVGSGEIAIHGLGAFTLDGGAASISGNRAVHLSTAAGDIRLNQPLQTLGGAITIAPEDTIELNHNGTVISQTTANLTFCSPVQILQDSVISQSLGNAGNSLTFEGTIDSTANNALTIDAGDSVLNLQGAVGSINPLSTLIVNANAAISIANLGNSVGPINGTTGATTVQAGTAGSITFTGDYYRTGGDQLWVAGTSATPRSLTANNAATWITQSTLTVQGNFTSTEGNPVLISNDIDLGDFGVWNWAGRDLHLRTFASARAMNIGFNSGLGSDWNLDDTELARLGSAGSTGESIVFGEDDFHSGGITFQTADLSGANGGDGIPVSVFTNAGAGRLLFDDSNDNPALNTGSGDIDLSAGTGGIHGFSFSFDSGSGPEARPHLQTTGTINLTSAGSIGGPEDSVPDPDPAEGPLQIQEGHDEVNVLNAPGGVYLEGIGDEILVGEISGVGGPLVLTVFDPTGFIRLTNNMTTSSQPITFRRPVRIDADGITLNTTGGGTVGADITFQSTLDSKSGEGNDLTLAAGTGNVFFREAVGRDGSDFAGDGVAGFDDPALGTITITSAGDVSIEGGLTTKIGTSDTGADLEINLTGILTILDTTGETDTADPDVVLEGAFSQTGASAVHLQGDIDTRANAAGTVSFEAPIVLTGHVRIDTDADGDGTGAAITFNDAATIGGNWNLTLHAPAAKVSFGTSSGATNGRVGGLGGANRVDTLTVENAEDLVFNGEVYANNLFQTTGTGVTTFEHSLDLTAAGSVVTDGQITVAADSSIDFGDHLILRSLSSPVVLEGPVNGAGGDGHILVSAEGAGSNVVVYADVTSEAGHITIKGGTNIALNADVDVTTATPGTVSLDAEDGVLTMAGSARVTATDSSARLAAQGNVTLANVSAANVSITSRAGAVENAPDSTKNVTGTNLRLEAEDSIGTSDRHLTTAVARVTAQSTSGSIFITEDDGAEVSSVRIAVTEFNADASTTEVVDAAQSDLVTDADSDGDIVLVATAGDITLTDGDEDVTQTDGDGREADGTAISADGSGNVLLQAVAGTVTGNADILLGTGHLTMKGGTNIVLNADVDVTTGTPGTVSLDAENGVLTMAGSARVTATGSSARLAAQGNVTLANVSAANVSIISRAGAVENAPDSTKNVTGTNLRLEADGSIGAPDRHLTTAVARVTAKSTSGSIFITEDDGAEVSSVRTEVREFNADASTTEVVDAAQSDLVTDADSDGDIVLVATAGDITLTDGDGTVDQTDGDGREADGTVVRADGSGNVLIQAVAGTVTGNADILSGTGHLTMKGGTNIVLNADVDVTTATPGTVSLDAEDGVLTMAGSARVTATGSSARLAAQGNVTLANVSAADVSIVSRDGGVTNAPDSTKNVTGTNLRLEVEDSIGTSDRHLTTAIDRMTARSATGSIFITEDDGLRIDEVPVTGTEVQPDAGTSDIVDVSQSAVASQGGDGEVRLQLLSGDLVQDSENGNISTTGTGGINVTVDAGSIEMEDGAVTETENGTITYEANGDITIGELISVSGDVGIRATTGSILAQRTLDADRGGRNTPVSEITTAGEIDVWAGSTIGRGDNESSTDDPDPEDGPFQILTGHTAVNVLNAPGGVWLEGVNGDIVIGEISGDVGPVTLTVFGDLSFIRLTENVTTSGQDIVFGRPVRVDEPGITVSTGPGGGHIDFTATLDSLSGEGNDLTLAAGTGNVFFREAVGRNGSEFVAGTGFDEPAMGSLTISASTLFINDALVTGTTAATTIDVTAHTLLQSDTLIETVVLTFTGAVDSDGSDPPAVLTLHAGEITFSDPVGGTHPLDHIRLRSASSLASTVPSGVGLIDLRAQDLYIDAAGLITVSSDLVAKNLFFFNGELDLAGRTLSTVEDLVIWGAGFNIDDPDWPGDDTRFGYFHDAPLAYYPVGASHNGHTVIFGDPHGLNASFAPGGLDGTTINVGSGDPEGGNFYNNGASMNVGAFTLNLQPNNSIHPMEFNPTTAVTERQWGVPYAVAFNMTVQNSTATGGWVTAVSDVDEASPEENNHNVVNEGGNTGWQFGRPEIRAAATVYDDMIRVTFQDQFGNDMLIANAQNEISQAVEEVFFHGGNLPFGGTFTDAEGTTSTDGQGPLQEFYIRTAALRTASSERWNTDATGQSPGDSLSTDRGHGVPGAADYAPPTHRDRIPDIHLQKGRLYAAQGNTMIRGYGNPGGEPSGYAAFSDTTDETRPVIVGVTLGRAPHERTLADTEKEPYDGHNYFHIRFSEAVSTGALLAQSLPGAPDPASNLRGQEELSGDDQWGGHLFQVEHGQVELAGFFRYPGTVHTGSRDADPVTTSVYRAGPENPSGDHGITLFMVGYSEIDSGVRKWPGYQWDVTDPAGEVIQAVSNEFITDTVGNSLEGGLEPYAKATIVATVLDTGTGAVQPSGTPPATMPVSPPPKAHLSGWDVDPPRFSTFNVSGDDTVFEIVAITDPVTNLINRLEFHVLDNSRIDFAGTHPEAVPQAERWDPREEGKTDSEGLPLTHTNTRPHEGIRESTWNHEAFTIGEAGSETFPVAPLEMVRDVNNSLFGEGINVRDDSYFALRIPEGGGDNRNWGLLTDLEVRYNQDEAFTTDLAGNLLPSFGFDGVPAMRVIQRVPPRMQLVLGRAGGRELYVKFNEPVIGPESEQITRQAFRVRREGGDWETPAGLEVLRAGEGNSVWEVRLRLDAAEPALAAKDFLAGKIAPSGTPGHPIRDRSGNAMPPEDTRRLSDLLLGVVEPLWATDSLGINDAGQGTFRTLREFDGHQELSRTDITLQARLHTEPPYEGIPLRLIVDADVPSSRKWGAAGEAGQFWMPELLPGLIDPGVEGGVPPHTGAMEIVPYDVDGTLRTFRIPGSSGPVSSGQELEFLFRAGGVGAARLLDPEDLLSLAPWRIALGTGFIAQRANVTILNNVIYPEAGESTVLVYELSRPGMVTVQVFSLDGSLIRTLQRGRQGRGTFRLAWDGRNNSNQIVARGIYFIRVVAPGVDEYRKVLIAK
ncbi:hypothetical protein AU468_08770 [Alkalispirochaeta sphaeroplastigenens]|uniref:FlgD/Vpr Ig-like domain-containing protein n=1 Tax=Alkalispirochaeta sphaeroplastigenens TaxID=1187066 RepID=A0A2S4JNN6_9SPIO|nr:FlgD immunoglobulin-like domain containing protein [Alkalispirochaeta sphaeroplastigenens]POR01131.1 hypothetical protein AU468_08770 [Alkalispirochaeta sphaeroplastigenens]